MNKSIILKGLELSIIMLIGIGISQIAANPIVVKSVYLDSEARYTIQLTGVGEFYTYADGKALRPITERKQTGEIVELTVPQSLTKDGSLKLTWQQQDESHLNWRQHSRLNEVWLIKNEP